MENIIIWQIVGFVVCFILLFVFIAKYHAALETEQDLEEVEGLEETTTATVQEPVFQSRAALLQNAQAPAALEIADLKEQVKTLYYHLEELKVATQKHEDDMASQIARLEARLGTFEQEYVNKLQPTLLRVIEELEHIKGGETPAEEAPDEATVGSPSKSPVPELTEEELKF
ncbi:MAG: hypothetical protein IJ876_07485 [Elusimicrobiaceae bacterium]|nr:hypothetical protein [Elusimicrobiaceae bacterium]